MDVYSIVTEYNPFHNGHKYQIDAIRKENPKAFIIVMMSGYFCQRGEPALLTPRKRAVMALQNGVDLVFQLPTYAATGSAELFAETAVRSLAATGLKQQLVFGAETDTLPELEEIADLLICQENEMWQFIKPHLKRGISYAKARELFVASNLDESKAALLTRPNQILAVEYLKAIRKYKLNLTVKLIPRIGEDDRSSEISDGDAASALAIREKITSEFPLNLKTIQVLQRQMPATALAICLSELQKGAFMQLEKLANCLYLQLENCGTATTRYLDYDLLQRIKQLLRFQKDSYWSIRELVANLVTRQYPATRVQRALINLLLEIPEVADFKPQYLHVLGFRRQGRYLLKQIQKRAGQLVISKFTELPGVLTKENLWQENLELRASRLWLNAAGQPINQVFDSPIILR